MSGPKRADVEAALNVAAAASRRSASLISAGETLALNHLLKTVDAALAEADQTAGSVAAASRDLGDARSDLPCVLEAKRAVAAAQASLRGAKGGASAARAALAEATRLDDQAMATFNAARAEYDRAAAALQRAGSHYLRDQMAWAKRASALYEEAAAQGAAAADGREKAKRAASRAMNLVHQANTAAGAAVSRSAAARKESDEQMRAEAQAQQIAEESRRKASLAVESARIAIDGLDAAACDKFHPGARHALIAQTAVAEQALLGGSPGPAERAAAGLPLAAANLAAEAAAAKHEFELLQAQANAATAELESAIEGADGVLIVEWSDDAGAADAARQSLTLVRASIAAERFPEATVAARDLTARLAEATKSAAESVGAHERREAIGEAVMNVLEEMGFDVSFEEGSKSDPLRIAGQTAQSDGRGDFDIEIPLDGEIDFEVAAQKGDGNCVSAVKALQDHLAERGVTWRTTDWGHGHEPAASPVTGVTVTRTEERTQTRTKTR